MASFKGWEKYLPIDGGILTGELSVNNDLGHYGADENVTTMTHRKNPGSSNMRNLMVSSTFPINDAVFLQDVENNEVVNSYFLYGDHNKDKIYLNDKVPFMDCNNATDGAYVVDSNAANIPKAGNASTLYHKTWDVNFATQIAIAYNNEIFFRTKINNVWNPWKRICNVGQSLELSNGHQEQTVLRLYDDDDGSTNYGSELLIGGNGNTYLGSGESASSLYELNGKSTGEVLYLTSDNVIHFMSKCNTIANRKTMTLNNDGTLTLAANPTANMHAATKQYVDSKLSGGVSVIKNIQRGIITIPKNEHEGTATISSVNTGKSIVVYGGAVYTDGDYDGGYSGRWDARLVLTNATTVTAHRAWNSNVAAYVPYQVVQFN